MELSYDKLWVKYWRNIAYLRLKLLNKHQINYDNYVSSNNIKDKQILFVTFVQNLSLLPVHHLGKRF